MSGPDGFAYYWNDGRRKKIMFSKKQSGGGDVMLWAAFYAVGISLMVILEGR